jgi:hypothetical protein
VLRIAEQVTGSNRLLPKAQSASMMARSAQTSRAAIHAYETGAREPNVTTALRLLQACGYTMGIIPDRR